MTLGGEFTGGEVAVNRSIRSLKSDFVRLYKVEDPFSCAMFNFAYFRFAAGLMSLKY